MKTLKINDGSKVWFTSDTHGYHKNIAKGSSKWPENTGQRDFENEFEMTNHLIKRINAFVKPNDYLFHNGDVTFGGRNRLFEFLNKINCNNIYVTPGNHDHHITNNALINCKLAEITNYAARTGLDIEFRNYSHEYDTVDVPAQQLFRHVSPYMEISVEKQMIVLCHYAMRVWNLCHRGSWMLYGHSHGSLDYPSAQNPYELYFKTMDVGVDSIYSLFGEYRPINFFEVKAIMDNKKVNTIDHHDENTSR
jgi:calcineurin-like phosphoesterase family protein